MKLQKYWLVMRDPADTIMSEGFNVYPKKIWNNLNEAHAEAIRLAGEHAPARFYLLETIMSVETTISYHYEHLSA